MPTETARAKFDLPNEIKASLHVILADPSLFQNGNAGVAAFLFYWQ